MTITFPAFQAIVQKRSVTSVLDLIEDFAERHLRELGPQPPLVGIGQIEPSRRRTNKINHDSLAAFVLKVADAADDYRRVETKLRGQFQSLTRREQEQIAGLIDEVGYGEVLAEIDRGSFAYDRTMNYPAGALVVPAMLLSDARREAEELGI